MDVLTTEQEGFDDIFFAKHGVGDVPIDRELQIIKHQINPMEATAQELDFCRLIVRGESKRGAYIKAFGYIGNELSPTTFNTYASRILQRPRVALMLHELREKVSDLAKEDIANLVHELNADRKLARDLGKPEAAISAVKAKAALLGLDNSSNQGNTNITINMNDSQKRQILERIGKSLIQRDVIDAEVVEEDK